jgi:hypothetical protein
LPQQLPQLHFHYSASQHTFRYLLQLISRNLSGARSRLEQLYNSAARGSLTAAVDVLRQIFEEKDSAHLLQVSNPFSFVIPCSM